MYRAVTALAGLVLLSQPSLAGGLDKSIVPADARWLVHVDVEAIQATSLFQAVKGMAAAEAMDLDDAWEGLREVEEEFGFNPLDEVHSVTIFGSSNEDEPVIQIAASQGIDGLFTKMREEDDYRSFTAGGVDLQSWEGTMFHHHSLDSGERIVLVSEEEDQLVHATRVLHGEADSLARSGNPAFAANPGPGAVLFVVVADGAADWADFDPASAVTEMVKGLVLEVGESRQRVTAKVAIEAHTPEDALNIASVINGAKALATLAAGNDGFTDMLRPYLDALRVQPRGSLVIVEFAYDSKQLVRDIEEQAQRGYIK